MLIQKDLFINIQKIYQEIDLFFMFFARFTRKSQLMEILKIRCSGRFVLVEKKTHSGSDNNPLFPLFLIIFPPHTKKNN